METFLVFVMNSLFLTVTFFALAAVWNEYFGKGERWTRTK